MMICVTAVNGASSSTYSPDSAPNDTISSITLCIGLCCPTTSSDDDDGNRGEDIEGEQFHSRYQSRQPSQITSAAVTIRLSIATGSSHFQPNSISWS